MRLRTVRRVPLAIAAATVPIPAVLAAAHSSMPLLVFAALCALPALLIPDHLFERWFLRRAPPG